MDIAVFTGASSGMGREFARQLAPLGAYDEIWVIARRRELLETLADEVGRPVRVLAMDLTDPASLDAYRDLLAAERPNVRLFVNASGFGKFGSFETMDYTVMMEMIDLNDKACVALTYLTLPYMTAGGEIYLLGSLSSFQPVPYINVYGATKAFVLSFSRALNVELKKRGIRVMAVCPGWVRTPFFERAVVDDTITYYNRFFTPEQVVRRAKRDMRRGKDVSVCGASVRFQVFLTKLLPHRLVMRVWCRQQKK